MTSHLDALIADELAEMDAFTAQTVAAWNADTVLTRTTLLAIAKRTYSVNDPQRMMTIATIAYSETGECWACNLITGHRDPEDREESPGSRNFRDFDGAAFYAEAWAWEADGDI
jgi:hypothetical protein